MSVGVDSSVNIGEEVWIAVNCHTRLCNSLSSSLYTLSAKLHHSTALQFSMIKLLITHFLIECLYLNSFSSFIETSAHYIIISALTRVLIINNLRIVDGTASRVPDTMQPLLLILKFLSMIWFNFFLEFLLNQHPHR